MDISKQLSAITRQAYAASQRAKADRLDRQADAGGNFLTPEQLRIDATIARWEAAQIETHGKLPQEYIDLLPDCH